MAFETPVSLMVIPLLAALTIVIGGCSDGGSDGVTATQTQEPGNTQPPPPGVAAVTVTSGTVFPSSPVRISFTAFNFTIGLPGSPHMRLSIDGGAQHDFYNGAGITSDNGVLLHGAHTHFVHWTSTNSFDLFGLAAGSHQVRLVLVDGSNMELAGSSTTHNFTVQSPPSGNLQLQSVLSGLIFPVGLAQASDGRIFFNERFTGNVRVINPGWQLVSTPFCTVSVQSGGEQGLLGLALDPNFTSNQTLYLYYTAFGLGNRVSKMIKQTDGSCSESVVLPNLPTSSIHNGGIIKFGPDGKLYVVIGDANNESNAQNLDSLAGKILRVNAADGSAAPGNPFSTSTNAQKVYSYGHRNSFGITFHPSTGQLWESENGPSSNDEVNSIVIGGNYGWPPWGGIVNQPVFIDPIFAFNPVIALTEIVGIPGNSSVYPQAYRNNLLVAAWNDGTIRLVIPNASNPSLPGTSIVAYPGGQGGLVSMMRASDGYVYVTKGGSGFSDGAI